MPRDSNKSSSASHARDEPYAKKSRELDHEDGSDKDVRSGAEGGVEVDDGITDFSDEHLKEVSGCWRQFFNLQEHGPMRRTEKGELMALRMNGKSKQYLAAEKANQRNYRNGKAVRELLKLAKEGGSVSALDKAKKLLNETEECVRKLCMETKESFIPVSARKTGSNFNSDNLNVRSLFD